MKSVKEDSRPKI